MKLNKKGAFLMGLEAMTIGWLGGMLLVSGISQLPAVKHDFRVKRAIEICEYDGGIACEGLVGVMDKEQLVAYIRDDGHTTFYDSVPVAGSGGGLRARILARQ